MDPDVETQIETEKRKKEISWKAKASRSLPKDFAVGCMTLLSGAFIAIAVAAAAGAIFMTYHVARWLTVPIVGLALLVLITIFLGRIVNFLRDIWKN